MNTNKNMGMKSSSGSAVGRFFWMMKYTENQEPGFIWSAFIGKTVDVMRVLIPLYFSRLVIGSVLSGEKTESVFMKAVALTSIYFLCTMISGYFQRRANYHYQRFIKKHQVKKALTVLEMDYGDTERDDIQNELVAIKQMERTVAMGIRTFQESFSILFGYCISIMVGVYLVWDLFFAPIAGVDFFTNWGLNIGYLAVVFLLHYLAVKVDLKTMKIYGETAQSIYVKNHRYLQQYSELLFDYKVGKDIRLYSEALGTHYNEVYRMRQSETYNVFARLFSSAGAKRNLLSTLITVLTVAFVGCRTLWGSIGLTDVFLCLGVLELLFANIEELTQAYGKIISSDVIRKKFMHMFIDKTVLIEPAVENAEASVGEKDSVSSTTSAYSFSASPDITSVCSSADKTEEHPCGGPSGSIFENEPNISRNPPTVEFRNVSFRYPNSERMVLNNVNLKIYGNQKLALVGLNGSGKSTLIKLLLGLYAPTEGSIFIHGEDTSGWKKERFVEYFSAVFQDFKLLSLRVGENVAASEEFDQNEVEKCLAKTGLSKFLEKNGTDRFLYRDFEEGGIEISGGEAQKIAMARAIYHGGKFFVLDEPTAALDPLSEYEIYTHFGEITSENPAIYISHRLSSCIFCDVVAVMDDGTIVQVGTHDKLLGEKEGLYCELWNAQAKHYRESGIDDCFSL